MSLPNKYTIHPERTLTDAIKKITLNKKQFVLIVDRNNCLLGILTDGDIRRGILKGFSLNDTVNKIMNANPITASTRESSRQIIDKMMIKNVQQCPIIDKKNKLKDIKFLDKSLTSFSLDNFVVIMAGGMGKRLSPYTKERPKPLMNIAGKPILERIIINLAKHGFKEIFLAVYYKSEMLEEFFGDGSSYGVKLNYIKEKSPLGTAGSISLLPNKPKKPFLVMNSDIVTDVNYFGLLDFHKKNKSIVTMCLKDFSVEVPYGVVQTNNNKILKIKEKPILTYKVNAGIYVLSPKATNYIPSNEYFDMTELFEILIKNKHKTSAFPIFENWADIANIEDLRKIDKFLKS